MKPFVAMNQKLGEVVLRQMIPKSQTWLQSVMLKIMSYLPLGKSSIKKLQGQFREAANAIQLKEY